MDEHDGLKKTGLKVTLPRLKVLSIFENSKEKHLSAEDIYKEMIGGGRSLIAMIAQILGFKRLAAIVIAFQAILWPVMASGDAATDWIDGPKADVRLISATTAVGDRDKIPLGIEVRLDDGWKTYWRSPGDAGIPPFV